MEGTTVPGSVATSHVAGTLLRRAANLIVIGVLPALVTLVLAPLARATFPGANGLLAYEDGSGPAPVLRVVSPDGTGSKPLFAPGDSDDAPAWSPDGRKLAFTRSSAGNDDIWVYDAARRTRPKQVTFGPSDDKDPAWSPDNRRLVFSSTRDGNAELYVLDTATRALQRLTFNPSADGQPAWSDTNRIAFVSDRTGNFDLFVTAPAPGAPATQLTRNPGPDVDPSWSPSGSAIAFASGASEDAMRIFTITPGGGPPRRLTGGPVPERFPSWAPDATAIAYTRLAPSAQLTIAMVNPAGLAVNPRAIVNGAEHPSWAPLPPAPPISQARTTPASTVTVTPAAGPVSAVPGMDSSVTTAIASPLSESAQLPVGPAATSTVLADAGLAVIRGSTTAPSAPQPVALLDASRAEITQPIRSAPLNVLLTSRPRDCGRTPNATAASHRRRRHRHVPNVRMRGRGRVRGRYSIGAAFGTQWITAETCAGTVTVVRRGVVMVTDRGRRKVPVKASHCHVASPRRLTPAQRSRACAVVRSLPALIPTHFHGVAMARLRR
jgi:hypothetical protein